MKIPSKRAVAIRLCSMACVVFGQHVPAAILDNGGFENQLAGWSATGHVSVKSGSPYTPAEGIRLAAFNSGNTRPDGVLSRSFATEPGRIYQIDFSAGVLSHAAGIQSLVVEIEGTARLLSKTVSLTGSADGRVSWIPCSGYFTADGPLCRLSFRDVSPTTNSIDLLLDHIRIVALDTVTLTVETSLSGGVPVTLFPVDLYGKQSGLAPLSRTYTAGTLVELTAPASIVVTTAPNQTGTLRFRNWRMDDADFSTNRSIRVALNENRRLQPVFASGLPIVLKQPSSINVPLGGDAVFQVVVDAPATGYSWYLNGNPIPGANQATLVIPSVTAADEGDYEVVVGDGSGSVTSGVARLTVDTALLVNGGFEQQGAGWHVEGNVRFIASPQYPATEGRMLANFNSGNSSPNGVLWQEFATVPGANYLLTFDAGVLSYLPLWQTMQILISNGENFGRQFSQRGAGKGKLEWFHPAALFIARDPITRISFIDTSPYTANIDLCLDHVQLFSMRIPDDSALMHPGGFLMGSPADEVGRQANEVLHQVSLDRALLVKQTEVTWKEWNEIRQHAGRFGFSDMGPGQNGTPGDASGSHPVTRVSWWDAVKWCNLRSMLLGLKPAYSTRPDLNGAGAVITGTPPVYIDWNASGYRLPTEAEWEYACRAGTTTAFHSGPITDAYASNESLNRVAWNYWNSGDAIHPVGRKDPNASGLFDVHGNVYEWCADWFGPYPIQPEVNQIGALSGTDRVIRGGSWSVTPNQCRSAFRASEPPVVRLDFVGFRPVRNAPP